MVRSIKRNILISSAGRRVELIEIWKKEAKKYLGDDVIVYANDINPSLSAACNVADYSFQICKVSDDNYIENLIRECISKNIGIVIPTIDTELEKLSKYRNVFQKEGINIIISDLDIVKICRNKRITGKFFKTLGIDSPEIFNNNNLKFPLFLKPYNGSSSVGLKIIKNDSQLSKDDINNSENIFQRLIPNDWDEYSADLFYKKDGNLNCCVTRLRISTVGGEINKGITKKNNIYNFLVNKLKFIKGARGPLTLQIFSNAKENKILAIELNARFGGGYPMSYACGANYPRMIIKEYLLNENINFEEEWDSEKLFLRHDKTICVEN